MEKMENKAKALSDEDLETVAGGGIIRPVDPLPPEKTSKTLCPRCGQPANDYLVEVLDTKEGFCVAVVTGVCPNGHKWKYEAY